MSQLVFDECEELNTSGSAEILDRVYTSPFDDGELKFTILDYDYISDVMGFKNNAKFQSRHSTLTKAFNGTSLRTKLILQRSYKTRDDSFIKSVLGVQYAATLKFKETMAHIWPLDKRKQNKSAIYLVYEAPSVNSTKTDIDLYEAMNKLSSAAIDYYKNMHITEELTNIFGVVMPQDECWSWHDELSNNEVITVEFTLEKLTKDLDNLLEYAKELGKFYVDNRRFDDVVVFKNLIEPRCESLMEILAAIVTESNIEYERNTTLKFLTK